MKQVDGFYRAVAVPFSIRKGPAVLRLEIKYEDGAVSGSATDQDFKLGQQAFRLSQISKLTLGRKAAIQLKSGAVIEGTVSGLESILVKVGNSTAAHWSCGGSWFQLQ
jgi:hypothetical protein